jgi:DNA-binding beta-propeller fold protein YncE
VARQPPSRTILIIIILLALVVGVSRTLRFQQRLHSKSTSRSVVSSGQTTMPAAAAQARLLEVGPWLLSNQTSVPMQVYGIGLTPGMTLALGPPLQRKLPLHVVDSSHAYARLPAARDLRLDDSESPVDAWLESASGDRLQGVAHLTLVDDAHFPDPTALALTPDGKRACATSTPTDELVCLTLEHPAVERMSVGDGPTALARFADGLLIAHAFAPELSAVVPGSGQAGTSFPAPTYSYALAVDEAKGVAYVAEQARDGVVALDLRHHGAQLWRAEVAPNPLRLALCGAELAVGSRQTGDVELLDAQSGKHLATIAPTAGTPIVGGHTEPFSSRIMGPSPVRDLVCAPKLGLLFVANTGPNIGPNPERMEVTQNGGVTVIDLAHRKVLYHLGFGAGVPQALALDETAGLLYAADVSLGLVHVLDVRKLARGVPGFPPGFDDARKAELQALPILPPADFPLVRDRADFGGEEEAGVSVHSGPSALALSAARDRLYVLDRFSGTLAEVDVRHARAGKATLTTQTALFDALGDSPGKRARRLGQVLYFADMGKTGMSCDTCHVEGHTGGILFSKGHPIRIYRSTGLRDARDQPPYFNPATTNTLEETARHVGSRNRFQKPQMTAEEAKELGRYSSEISTPPNPFVGEDGAPVKELVLPDGAKGHPLEGLALFEGKASCKSCHPAPIFTTDQWASTRGRYLAVGTPEFFPLRQELQDAHPRGYPPPTLLGVWDMFPLLGSGTGGLGVQGDQVVVATRFPLRWVIEHRGDAPHGAAAELSADEKNDLLAYLMSL